MLQQAVQQTDEGTTELIVQLLADAVIAGRNQAGEVKQERAEGAETAAQPATAEVAS